MSSQQIEKIEVQPRNTRGWPKTQQQLDWALFHVRDGLSAYHAAQKAGYSEQTCKKLSYQLVDKMRPFLAFLQERKNEVAERRYNASTTRVLREITALAFSNHADYVREVTIKGIPHLIGKPINALTEEQQLCVTSYSSSVVETDEGRVVDYKYTLHDKAQNLFALGKHLGMFNEKIMLELTHREAQSRRTNFADLPTETIEQIVTTLNEFKEMARNATAIPSTATEVTP